MLWVGTEEGVAHVVDGVVVDPGLVPESTTAFAMGPDGDVWVATEDGVFHVVDGVATQYRGAEAGFSDDRTFGAAYLPDGRLWVVARKEVLEWTGEGFEEVPAEVDRRSFAGMAVLGDGRVLVPNGAGTKTLVVFERNGTVFHHDRSEVPGRTDVERVLADPSDPRGAWLLTQRGILRFVGGAAAEPGPQ